MAGNGRRFALVTEGRLARGVPGFALAVPVALLCGGCGPGADEAVSWSGVIDTLPSGEITVNNTADPIWSPDEFWQAVEELRIGSAMADGPDLFGGIYSFDVDAWGRIFILDDQEIRLFDAGGAFVRTIGGRGEGPGEMQQAAKVDLARDGEVWVMDQGRGLVSIFDTAGTFLRQEHTAGGVMILPYPGGLDPTGLYSVIVSGSGGRLLARFNHAFRPVDTISVPQDPVERDYFTLVSDDGGSRISASVPFQGSLRWRLSPAGTVWTLLTDRYELTETTAGGEVLRRVVNKREAIPVTSEEVDRAVDEDLAWFTEQGGTVSRSRIPGTKPPVAMFFIDGEGNLWVERQVAAASERDAHRLFDILDPVGRYLGTLRLPFAVRSFVEPVFRGGALYAVASDELGVQQLVRARIVKP